MRKYTTIAVILVLCSFTGHSQDLGNIKTQKPIRISGNFEIRGIGYQGDGTRNPFTWYLFGSPTISIYGVSLPFSFAFSEEEKTFSQPFNRYGVSPTYKWIKLHLGYRNLQFSPYTLGGHTVYGAGCELTPGKWRLGFVYGRFNKATTVDSASGYVRPVSFSRKGYAAKVGYGTRNSFLDFSFLKARDDSNSVSQHGADSANMVHPAANMVGSAVLRVKLSSHLILDADAGLSLYTTNINSRDDLDVLKGYDYIFPVNLSTEKYIAYSAALTYREKFFALKTAYKWVEPGFRSMGTYFFNQDLEQISVIPSFQLWKNRLRFSGSLGLQHDNVRKQKVMTTRRTIWSASMGADFSRQLGLDVNVTNYAMNATPQVSQVNQKYMLTNTSQTFSVGPRYILMGQRYGHTIIGNYTESKMQDANDSTQTFNDIDTRLAFLSYSINIMKQALSLNLSLNQTATTFQSKTNEYIGGSAGVSKGLLDNKAQVGSTLSYTHAMTTGGNNFLNVSLSAQYSINRQHRFSLRWVMMRSEPNTSLPASALMENTGEISYQFSF